MCVCACCGHRPSRSQEGQAQRKGLHVGKPTDFSGRGTMGCGGLRGEDRTPQRRRKPRIRFTHHVEMNGALFSQALFIAQRTEHTLPLPLLVPTSSGQIGTGELLGSPLWARSQRTACFTYRHVKKRFPCMLIYKMGWRLSPER